jgi:adenylosuccinate synthase
MPTELFDATADGIRTRGREFGTTTGRPRRVGWLDLVAVKYSTMINGVSGLCLTLLDVLSGVDELKVCTAYEIDGQRTDRFLPDGADLARAKPVFTTLPGFPEAVGTARKLSDLPAAARKYIDFIQNHTGVPMAIVSVGPDREQTMMV